MSWPELMRSEIELTCLSDSLIPPSQGPLDVRRTGRGTGSVVHSGGYIKRGGRYYPVQSKFTGGASAPLAKFLGSLRSNGKGCRWEISISFEPHGFQLGVCVKQSSVHVWPVHLPSLPLSNCGYSSCSCRCLLIFDCA